MEWLLSGALGLVAGAGGMGLLLWWETRKRGAAEKDRTRLENALDECEETLDRQTGRAATLSKLVARKDTRIAELEAQLAAVNPGQLLDDVFGGMSQDPTAGKAGTGG
jgi:hypothetical protein